MWDQLLNVFAFLCLELKHSHSESSHLVVLYLSSFPFRVAYSNRRLVKVVAKIKLEGGKIKNVTVSYKANSCITTVGHFTKGHKNL